MSATCQICGGALPAEASGCPRCLLGLGLETGPAPAPALEAGDRFAEFEILGLIGQGGMGTVYRARQARLKREVALKIIPSGLDVDPEFGARFRREAQALAGLNHPQVVTLHDFGEHEAQTFLVMELVDGADLQRRLASGPLAPRLALEIGVQVCEALMHAHAHGVVHRDIKPGNVLIDEAGRVKVADFGLAKLLDSDGFSLSLTDTAQTMGTPFYIAPEQRAGSRSVDHRADIYSLGVMLYQMLTGELPAGTFPSPSSVAPVGRRIDRVVERAMQNDPGRRFQQAAELRDALAHCLRPGPTRWLAPIGVALTLALVIGLALRNDRATRQRRKAGEPPAKAVAPAVPRDVVQFGERYFKVFYQHLSWHAARARCESMGGRLAAIRTREQDLFLARLSRSHVWLGGSDAAAEGRWRWSDGTPVVYRNWAEGEPNNLQQREHFLMLSKYGQWNDLAADSSIVKGFICEWDLDQHPGPLRLATAAELHAALQQVNPDYDGTGKVVVAGGEIREVDLAHQQVSDIRPLAGLPLRRLDLSGTAVRNLWPLARMPLSSLALGRSQVVDLAPLAGLPLLRLKLNGTGVTDLSPLRGLKLTYLDISHTRISDLSALAGMPLAALHMNRARVTDIRVLAGLPLRELGLLDVPVRDLSPLAGCARLEQVHVPLSAPGLQALRKLRGLKRINNQPAERFWREH